MLHFHRTTLASFSHPRTSMETLYPMTRLRQSPQRSNDAGALLVCTVHVLSPLSMPSLPTQYALPETALRDVVWFTTRRRPAPVGSVGCVSTTTGRLFDVDTSYVPSNAGCITTDAGPFEVRTSERRRARDGASSYWSLVAPLLVRDFTTKLPPVPESVMSHTDEVIGLCMADVNG